MIKSPLFLENLTYSATDLRRLLDVVTPVPGCIATGDLAVSQHAAGANMSVDVASGSAVIEGTTVSKQGNYLFTSDSVTNVAIAPAPASGNSRIDLIVAKIEDADVDGGSTNAGVIVAVTGTAAATGTEVAPSAPASSLVLAQVLVGPLVTSIVTANITDERGFAGDEPMVDGNTIGSTFPVTTSYSTWLTTGHLAVGTWLIIVTAQSQHSSTDNLNLKTIAGTATATFVGPSTAFRAPGTTSIDDTETYAFVAIVTAAGTLVHQGLASAPSTVNILSGSGYVAVRL